MHSRLTRTSLLVTGALLASCPFVLAGESDEGGPSDALWNRYTGVRLSEVLFTPHPTDGDDIVDEYVEVHFNHHPAAIPIDISGWTIEAQSGGIFTFPAGTVLGGDTFATVWFGDLAGVHGTGATAPGSWEVDASAFGNAFLGDNGDFIVLRDADGAIKDAVGYANPGFTASGSLMQEAVSSGEWIGPHHVHLFSAAIDDVGIARENYTADTETESDWTDGLRVGPTPGKDNESNVDDDKVFARVVDADGAPIVGATVVVPDHNVYTTSDAAGYVLFEDMPPGSYDVYAQAPGYLDQVVPVYFKSPHHAFPLGAIPMEAVADAPSVSATIGAGGGWILASSDPTPAWGLYVPPGALSSPTEITVTEIAPARAPVSHLTLDSLRVAGSNVFRVGELMRGFDMEPDGLTFAAGLPAQLYVRYDGEFEPQGQDDVKVTSFSNFTAQLEADGAVAELLGEYYSGALLPHFSKWSKVKPVDGQTVASGLIQIGPRTGDANQDGAVDFADALFTGSSPPVCEHLCPGDSVEREVCAEVKISSTTGSGWEVSGSASVETGKLTSLIAKGTVTVGGKYERSSSTTNESSVKWCVKRKLTYSATENDKQEKCLSVLWQMIKYAPPGTPVQLTFNSETGQWELPPNTLVLVPVGTTIDEEIVGHCTGG